MPQVNLDTHVLIYALQGQLRIPEIEILSSADWSISSIVLWEMAKLNQLGRIHLDLNHPLVLDSLSKLHVWPLTLDIALKACNLDFSSDPADEVIAATSIIHGVPLLTRDRKIRASSIVPFA